MLEQQKPKNPVSKQADNSIAGVKPRADGRFYSLDGTKSMSAKEFKEYVENGQIKFVTFHQETTGFQDLKGFSLL